MPHPPDWCSQVKKLATLEAEKKLSQPDIAQETGGRPGSGQPYPGRTLETAVTEYVKALPVCRDPQTRFCIYFWFGMTKPSLKRHVSCRREVPAGRRVFVNQLVIMETEWVLRSRYAVPKNQIIEAISGLLDAADVQFEDEPVIEQALFIWKDATADFADCLIGAKNRRLGCRATASFDSKASKLPGFMVA